MESAIPVPAVLGVSADHPWVHALGNRPVGQVGILERHDPIWVRVPGKYGSLSRCELRGARTPSIYPPRSQWVN